MRGGIAEDCASLVRALHRRTVRSAELQYGANRRQKLATLEIGAPVAEQGNRRVWVAAVSVGILSDLFSFDCPHSFAQIPCRR